MRAGGRGLQEKVNRLLNELLNSSVLRAKREPWSHRGDLTRALGARAAGPPVKHSVARLLLGVTSAKHAEPMRSSNLCRYKSREIQ
ncbi:hypothetical protein NDU88_001451 [Pleurodeles waltl]|uniref:Uncharacterized protein n=1 Tax=Pleurodeles waltl TaxID=8319 RepID=A0AAV7KSP3_PLEWA|nr:hypothetical protein NDU88_001451 [Pleurodeles waltl]